MIVDEAHHCKNRATQNWQLVNALKRRHLFLLSATPVQNNLLELYNLLTLLEPGHLKTESDFKRQYVRRGNPRDPRNRERLRSLLGEVMVRNTRSLVQMDLPARYAQTILAQPQGDEAALYETLDGYLRRRRAPLDAVGGAHRIADEEAETAAVAAVDEDVPPAAEEAAAADAALPPLGRRQLSALLAGRRQPCAAHGAIVGEHRRRRPGGAALDRPGPARRPHGERRAVPGTPAPEPRREDAGLRHVPPHAGASSAVVGQQRASPSSRIPARNRRARRTPPWRHFCQRVPVMLCSESGGEGRNLQFANTLVNFDLPWNPMRIEQRVGRIHRIGQTRDVFIFNLCTAGSLEARILALLDEKIRMFELVVGEVGSILGNLQGGEEFESLVLDLWLRSHDDRDLQQSFDSLGQSLLDAQEEYLRTKRLDEALFGEEFQ